MSEIDTLNSRAFFDGINIIPLSWWAQISDTIEYNAGGGLLEQKPLELDW